MSSLSQAHRLREKWQKRKKDIQNVLLSGAPVDLGGSAKVPKLEERVDEVKKEVDIANETLSDKEEISLVEFLVADGTDLPTHGADVKFIIAKGLDRDAAILGSLRKLHSQGLLKLIPQSPSSLTELSITWVDVDKLTRWISSLRTTPSTASKKSPDSSANRNDQGLVKKAAPAQTKIEVPDSVEALLSLDTTKERETKKLGGEILELLSKPSAKERVLYEKFKSAEGAQVNEFCMHSTKEDCAKVSADGKPCNKLHFIKIIQSHTDVSLGDCSFLNTCFHMESCKFIHYRVDYSTAPDRGKAARSKMDPKKLKSSASSSSLVSAGGTDSLVKGPPMKMYPPQWIQCDMRSFDLTVLGKFAVIQADPPWDIHMELPYGTMADDEMRKLNVSAMQDDGLIFLWVTGRAMELGRECLTLWGYEQVDELIWVKTNQLQRIIRTGRTGHWLNHGKEHCLVGKKGKLDHFNVGMDCDVFVSEVRATSHKPDEIYGMIERLAPGQRKVEMFGRMHNCQPNWITLGNQLDGIRLLDPSVVSRFKERYPDGNCMPQPNQQAPNHDGNPPIPGL